MLPLILFEDEHLLAINKPAGLNTHAPDPFANEGVFDWLRHREPRWGNLAIIHRLDKETSGVLLFSKSQVANRSLADQFASRAVKKRYVFLTGGKPPVTFSRKSEISRLGDKYVSKAGRGKGVLAETRFRILAPRTLGNLVRGDVPPGLTMVEAEPLTGRTHQIRVHAAENGFPIEGDVRYGGPPAARLFLHALELSLQHPATAQPITFRASFNLNEDARQALRQAVIDPDQTDVYRIVHGASDAWPGWYVDRFGSFLLSQSAGELTEAQLLHLRSLLNSLQLTGAYHKVLSRQVRRSTPAQASPRLILGEAAPENFVAHENGLAFQLSFDEGYSVGLFPDQRENRRRLITRHLGAGFDLPQTTGESIQLLNTFSYTCAFSVASASAGLTSATGPSQPSHSTSLDLSRKYLDWGRRNFDLNRIPTQAQDFVYGDVFDWLRRFAKKNRFWDIVILDPPTFSQSKVSGVFRTERDYGKLVHAALAVLKRPGILFASCNTEDWLAPDFVQTVTGAVGANNRSIRRRHYVPQPPDFPISRSEPAYLKALWMEVE